MFQPPPHLCPNGSVPPPMPPRMILTGGYNHSDPYRQPYVWGAAAPPSRPPWLHFEDSPHERNIRFNSPPFRCDRLKPFMVDKKLFQCPHCKYVTDRKNNLKRHVATMHDICTKLLECCDQIFPNKASLRDHVIRCHRDGYECRLCGRNFCRKALLKRHITVHSGKKDFVCSFCGYATSHRSNLERHKKRHAQAGQGGGGSEDAESRHSDTIDIMNDDSMDEDEDLNDGDIDVMESGINGTDLKTTEKGAVSLFRPFETGDNDSNDHRETKDYDTDSNPSSPEAYEKTRSGPNSVHYKHKKYRYMAVLKDKAPDSEYDGVDSAQQYTDADSSETQRVMTSDERLHLLPQKDNADAEKQNPFFAKENDTIKTASRDSAIESSDDVITISDDKDKNANKPEHVRHLRYNSNHVNEKETGFQINDILKGNKNLSTTFHHYIDQHFNHKDNTRRKSLEPAFSMLENDMNDERRLQMLRERSLFGGVTMDYQSRHFGDLIDRTSAHFNKFRHGDPVNPGVYHQSRDGYPGLLYDTSNYSHQSQGMVITTFRCDLCSKMFRDQLELREHYEQNHLLGRGPFQKPVRLLATVQICD